MTRHLFAAWSEVEALVACTRRIAFFTDFDGTLTPIRSDPTRVRLDKRTRRFLEQLAAHGVVVGIVSGRAIADLQARVGVPGVWYAGNHGFVVRGPGHRTLSLITRPQQARINLATRRLRRALRTVAGVTVEAKRATVAVHYRNAPAHSRRIVAETAHKTINGSPGLRLMHGKKVWEVLPAGPVDKSTAIDRILDLRGRRRGELWLPIYVGDDVADEQVFATWGGLSIAVGRHRETAAQYYLRSPAEVREFLRRLAGLVIPDQKIFESPTCTPRSFDDE